MRQLPVLRRHDAGAAEGARHPARRATRGQALVETALILPILVLVLVIGIDFGRVFFGWVALQSAARVGADYAAQWSSAWEGMAAEEQDKRDRYVALIEADIRAINCDLAGGTPPDPMFEDGLDTGALDTGDYDDGDYAIVELECSFGLITPLAESLFGGPIAMIAHEEFPIHRSIILGVPDSGPLPGCPTGQEEVPDMVGEGQTLAIARDLWVDAGFSEANFSPTVVSTGPPSGRNANKVTTSQSLAKNECQPTATSTVTIGHLP